jgi:CRISPR-associated protein (TIGR02710 family)
MTAQTSQPHILLICTLGGAPQPIKHSIETLKPKRCIFLVSAETVPERIGEQLRLGFDDKERTRPVCIGISSANCVVLQVKDPQRIGGCVDTFSTLAAVVREWTGSSNKLHSYEVVVDFTGGTKAMSAALVLCARVWECRLAYVAGKHREKGGVGIVATGSEFVIEESNPWEFLGFQAAEEFIVHFNAGDFSAAEKTARTASDRADEKSPVRTRMNALADLADGYKRWEMFSHEKALNVLTRCAGRSYNIVGALQHRGAQTFLEDLKTNIAHLERLAGPKNAGPSLPRIADLLANALRRAAEQRYEDAVARLYRAVEAMAQWRLLDSYQITAGAVRSDQIPGTLADALGRADAAGLRKLALQDCYRLLQHLNDPLGNEFCRLKLDQRKSPLNSRNESILAHGFTAATPGMYEGLYERCAKPLWQLLAEGITLPALAKIG